jgi:hypothetical protein
VTPDSPTTIQGDGGWSGGATPLTMLPIAANDPCTYSFRVLSSGALKIATVDTGDTTVADRYFYVKVRVAFTFVCLYSTFLLLW